ncbi:MAG: PhzF family phenazine biosynthesis protein [Pseudomonadota bacterium]
MNVQRLAAFTQGQIGGNPAGVVFVDEMPADSQMLAVAAEVGFSETAFLQALDEGFRIRYFSPETEVPFCGHASIASAAAIGQRWGEGDYKFLLNAGEISITTELDPSGLWRSSLQSPPAQVHDTDPDWLQAMLAEFAMSQHDLNPTLPCKIASAGARHLIVPLSSRERLRAMQYDMAIVKALMLEQGLITVCLFFRETHAHIHSRNAFAVGGVFEDPATGAAAAALGGYLREYAEPANDILIEQGTDMGIPCQLDVTIPDDMNAGIKVAGTSRAMSDDE